MQHIYLQSCFEATSSFRPRVSWEMKRSCLPKPMEHRTPRYRRIFDGIATGKRPIEYGRDQIHYCCASRKPPLFLNRVLFLITIESLYSNYNRHYAEHSGYFEKQTKFLEEATSNPILRFFDSNTGKLLFTAPQGRTMDDFLQESRAHGWPSFRGAYVLVAEKSFKHDSF